VSSTAITGRPADPALQARRDEGADHVDGDELALGDQQAEAGEARHDQQQQRGLFGEEQRRHEDVAEKDLRDQQHHQARQCGDRDPEFEAGEQAVDPEQSTHDRFPSLSKPGRRGRMRRPAAGLGFQFA